jgi:cytochrome c553
MTPKDGRHGNSWVTAAIAVVAVPLLASAGAGFVLFPALQDQGRGASLWAKICGAAGVAPRHHAVQHPVTSIFPTSTVLVTSLTSGRIDAGSIGRGATLATACTSCHGARGVSDAASPNLAGQYAASVYKQLRDFDSGARVSAVMSPRVSNLSEADMRDLAAYYAFLPRPTDQHRLPAAPAIVATGAPMRNIAPCAACHGPGGHTMAAPSLTGEPYIYLSTQLGAFASGARPHDISQQMRNVARGMSGREIEAAARFYAQGS